MLDDVTERRVSQVVNQGGRFDYVRIQAADTRDHLGVVDVSKDSIGERTANLCHFK